MEAALAILQPFGQDSPRGWQEVRASTLLMLHIADMVRARTRRQSFSFAQATAALERMMAEA